MNRGNRSNPDEPFGFWNYGITNTDIDLHVLLTAAGFRANLAVMCGLWSNERRSGNGGSVVRTADRRPRQAVRDVVAGIV